jgi:hypothetical protein
MGLTARHEQGFRNPAENSHQSIRRAQDAAVQIACISPALFVDSLCPPQHLQRPAPSHIPRHASLPSRTSVAGHLDEDGHYALYFRVRPMRQYNE